MKNATLSFLVLAAAGTSAAAETTSGLEAYLSRVNAAEAAHVEACETLRAGAEPPAGRVWLRTGPEGIEIAPADSSAAEAAAFWADAALGARAAAELLYGQAVGQGLKAAPVMIETGVSGVTVHDGKAMANGDACDALERIVSALGEGGQGSPFAAARAAAANTESIALPVGGSLETALASASDGAFARGPDGVLAEIVETDEGPRLFLQAGPDARPGPTEARLYGPNDKFRPIEVIPLTILPGAAASNPGTGSLSVGGESAGVMRLGDENALSLVITDEQRVAFTSVGEADVSAVLETESGAVIARDDDSGEGYGFAFSAKLAPGRYTLKLRHCCGGGGGYTVSATSE